MAAWPQEVNIIEASMVWAECNKFSRWSTNAQTQISAQFRGQNFLNIGLGMSHLTSGWLCLLCTIYLTCWYWLTTILMPELPAEQSLIINLDFLLFVCKQNHSLIADRDGRDHKTQALIAENRISITSKTILMCQLTKPIWSQLAAAPCKCCLLPCSRSKHCSLWWYSQHESGHQQGNQSLDSNIW